MFAPAPLGNRLFELCIAPLSCVGLRAANPIYFSYLSPSIASARQSPDDSLRYASHHHIRAGALAGTLMDYRTGEGVLNVDFSFAYFGVSVFIDIVSRLRSPPPRITSMESCWASESDIGNYITTDCAPSRSAQSTAPPPTGQISQVCFSFFT